MAKVNVSRVLRGFPGGSQHVVCPFPIFSNFSGSGGTASVDCLSASGDSVSGEGTTLSSSGMKCCRHPDKSEKVQGILLGWG